MPNREVLVKCPCRNRGTDVAPIWRRARLDTRVQFVLCLRDSRVTVLRTLYTYDTARFSRINSWHAITIPLQMWRSTEQPPNSAKIAPEHWATLEPLRPLGADPIQLWIANDASRAYLVAACTEIYRQRERLYQSRWRQDGCNHLVALEEATAPVDCPACNVLSNPSDDDDPAPVVASKRLYWKMDPSCDGPFLEHGDPCAVQLHTPKHDGHCAVHAPDPCVCGEYTDEQAYAATPAVYRRQWPEFAVGSEYEFCGAEKPVNLVYRHTFVSNDGSLKDFPSAAPAYGEAKINSWDRRAAIHAANAAALLRKCGVTVNHSCGLHIHCDARWAPVTHAPKVFARYAAIEPWLLHAVFPTRRDNRYCTPICGALDSDGTIRRVHYSAVNQTSKSTIEFRFSPGTTNWFHAYAWTQFVMDLYAGRPIDRDAITALALGRRVGVAEFATFCDRLRRRDKTPNWPGLAQEVIQWVIAADENTFQKELAPNV